MITVVPHLSLHEAIARNEVEPCLLLIEQGIDLEAVDPHGRTALRLACQQDALQMRPVIQALIMLGANLDAKDLEGYSPRQACMEKEFETPQDASSWFTFFEGTLAMLQARQLDLASASAKSTSRRQSL